MKRIAIINDLSGFGKCSLTAAIPIISVMGVEAHPLPTAVLSNQTAYESYKCRSLTDSIIPFAEEWKKHNFHFDAILTGFATDATQLKTIIEAVNILSDDNTVVVVDPVMADNGSLYDCYNDEMCTLVKELCNMADVITPNLSELFIIAGRPFSNKLSDIESCGRLLMSSGIKNIVATGYKSNGKISNILFSNDKVDMFSAELTGDYFSGTGDILSSIVAVGAAKGKSLLSYVKTATDFISLCAANTVTDNVNNGVDFENHLSFLIESQQMESLLLE